MIIKHNALDAAIYSELREDIDNNLVLFHC